jgi:hypothetical protein
MIDVLQGRVKDATGRGVEGLVPAKVTVPNCYTAWSYCTWRMVQKSPERLCWVRYA